MHRFPIVVIAVTSVFLMDASPASAQVEPTTTRVEELVVRNPKNAAVTPYDAVYERMKRFRDSKLDRVSLDVRVKSNAPDIKQSDIRVSLVNDTQSLPLKLDIDGRIELPLREDFYKTNAELLTNQPKGTLSTSVTIGVSWDGADELPYAEVEETIRQLQMAGKDVLGWFGYMIFFPSVYSIDIPIQYKTPGQQRLDIVRDGKIIQSFVADEKGLLKFRLDRRWAEWQPVLRFSERPPKG